MGLDSIYNAYKNIVLKTDIYKLMEYKGSNIYIKREDDIGYSYGGNSVRIAVEFFKDMYEKNADAVISYGSRHSNINRVVSELAKDAGIPCRIVTSLVDSEFKFAMDAFYKQLVLEEDSSKFKKHRNEILADQNGALRTYCKKSEVKQTIEEVISQLRAQNRSVYYIYGNSDGNGNENIALRAYDLAYDEIVAYEKETGVEFDCIVVAYGTGMTLEGLIRGRNRNHRNGTLICGISIAKEITEFNLEEFYFLKGEYNGGGYEVSDYRIESFIEQMNVEHDICLDPVYTGKAFVGMLREIGVRQFGGNILFIHTGGRPVYDEWRENKDKRVEFISSRMPGVISCLEKDLL